MGEQTVFDKILAGEIPADIVFENEHCIAFRDIQPQAPVHVLVIPRRKIAGLQEATPEDAILLGQLMAAACQVAEQEGILGPGFRCVVNAGPDGGQEVPFLHVHVLGGRQLEWPPG
jgi:histidine triad (HIT) family protein